MTLQRDMAVLSIALLLWTGLAQAAPPQAPKSHEQALKEQLIEIPAGAVVEVRLENKQKLRGKLGTATDAGFDLQTVRDGKIVTNDLRFDQIESIKYHRGMSTAPKVVLYILAGIGVFVLIVAAIGAASGWGSD